MGPLQPQSCFLADATDTLGGELFTATAKESNSTAATFGANSSCIFGYHGTYRARIFLKELGRSCIQYRSQEKQDGGKFEHCGLWESRIN